MTTAQPISTSSAQPPAHFRVPLNLSDIHYIQNKHAYHAWIRENTPVIKAKISVINVYCVSRYEDCLMVLKDPRFVRNRATATGGGNRLPFPAPKYIQVIANSMILEDEPNHRRLRNLVHTGFVPRNLASLGERVEALTHELFANMAGKPQVDLQQEYALPIPVTVITEMMGLQGEDMTQFQGIFSMMTKGLTGRNLAHTMLWKLPRLTRFIRQLIRRKKANPGADILTALIQAEEAGSKLTEDELVSMIYLLVIAGYETTVHLITNSVLTLLQHPDQLALLKANPDLMESAIEEILRFNGPIDGTKPNYATEAITLHGVTIPKGAAVMPLLGAANHDPRAFENPDVFDITRSPNQHFGFGRGIHYCLGAPLARLETKIALTNLFERFPNLRLAVDPSELTVQPAPAWTRYNGLPIMLE